MNYFKWKKNMSTNKQLTLKLLQQLHCCIIHSVRAYGNTGIGGF